MIDLKKLEKRIFYIKLYDDDLEPLYLSGMLMNNAMKIIESYLIDKSKAYSLRLQEILTSPHDFSYIIKVMVAAEEDLVVFWLTLGDRVVRRDLTA